MRLYGMAMSGNCWKPAQILRLTGYSFDWVETDTTRGDTTTAAFLALNPQGEVPVLVLDDGEVITQSNAILTHFAEATPWLPPPGLARTRVMQWLFWEQYSHEPYIAVARWLITYRGQKQAQAERLKLCAERGRKALGIAYTHVADEGEFDLAETPAVAAWVKRLAALPGITTLPRPPGFAAI